MTEDKPRIRGGGHDGYYCALGKCPQTRGMVCLCRCHGLKVLEALHMKTKPDGRLTELGAIANATREGRKKRGGRDRSPRTHPYQRVYPSRAGTGIGHGIDPDLADVTLCGRLADHMYVDHGANLFYDDCKVCVRVAVKRRAMETSG